MLRNISYLKLIALFSLSNFFWFIFGAKVCKQFWLQPWSESCRRKVKKKRSINSWFTGKFTHVGFTTPQMKHRRRMKRGVMKKGMKTGMKQMKRRMDACCLWGYLCISTLHELLFPLIERWCVYTEILLASFNLSLLSRSYL